MWIIIIIIPIELAFAHMSVSHKQQLITSVNTQDFQQGQLADCNSNGSNQQPAKQNPQNQQNSQEADPKKKNGTKHSPPSGNSAVLQSVTQSSDDEDVNIVYVTVTDDSRSKQRRGDRRNDRLEKKAERGRNYNDKDRNDRHPKPRRNRSPQQRTPETEHPQQVNPQSYMYLPNEKMGMFQPQTMMKMPNQFIQNPQGQIPMSYMNIYPPNMYPPMNYYYPMPGYHPANMMMNQQQNSNPMYMQNQQPMPNQYMMQQQYQQHQQHAPQHNVQQPPQPVANPKNELHEQIKIDIRKSIEGIEKKEDFLRAVQGLLKDPNSASDLKKVEELLNEETSKKAVTEVMKALKMDDTLLKAKEKRLSNRLMNLLEPQPTDTKISSNCARKDPRVRE